jgi:hypothetical protein
MIVTYVNLILMLCFPHSGVVRPPEFSSPVAAASPRFFSSAEQRERLGFPGLPLNCQGQTFPLFFFVSALSSLPRRRFQVSFTVGRSLFANSFSLLSICGLQNTDFPLQLQHSARLFSPVVVFFVSAFGRRQVTALGEFYLADFSCRCCCSVRILQRFRLRTALDLPCAHVFHRQSASSPLCFIRCWRTTLPVAVTVATVKADILLCGFDFTSSVLSYDCYLQSLFLWLEWC